MSLLVLFIALLHALPVLVAGYLSNDKKIIFNTAIITAVFAIFTGALIFTLLDWFLICLGYHLAVEIFNSRLSNTLSTPLKESTSSFKALELFIDEAFTKLTTTLENIFKFILYLFTFLVICYVLFLLVKQYIDDNYVPKADVLNQHLSLNSNGYNQTKSNVIPSNSTKAKTQLKATKIENKASTDLRDCLALHNEAEIIKCSEQ